MLYTQDTVQKAESQSSTKRKKMAVRYLEQQMRENISSRRRVDDGATHVVAVTRGTGKGKGRGEKEIPLNGPDDPNFQKGQNYSFKHDSAKRGTGNGKLSRGRTHLRAPKRMTKATQKKYPVHPDDEISHTFDYWYPPNCILHKKRQCHRGTHVPSFDR